MMNRFMKNFETRDLIALITILGFVVASFTALETIAGLKEISLMVIGFYFGNKSALDKS